MSTANLSACQRLEFRSILVYDCRSKFDHFESNHAGLTICKPFSSNFQILIIQGEDKQCFVSSAARIIPSKPYSVEAVDGTSKKRTDLPDLLPYQRSQIKLVSTTLRFHLSNSGLERHLNLPWRTCLPLFQTLLHLNSILCLPPGLRSRLPPRYFMRLLWIWPQPTLTQRFLQWLDHPERNFKYPAVQERRHLELLQLLAQLALTHWQSLCRAWYSLALLCLSLPYSLYCFLRVPIGQQAQCASRLGRVLSHC